MGLALLDVADVIRPYPEVIDYLQHVKNDNFLDELLKFDGGQEALKKEQRLLERLRQLADGEQKSKETKRMIDLMRNFNCCIIKA